MPQRGECDASVEPARSRMSVAPLTPADPAGTGREVRGRHRIMAGGDSAGSQFRPSPRQGSRTTSSAYWRTPAAVALVALLIVAACTSRTYLTPEVAGVVVDVAGTNEAARFRLANGAEYVIAINNAAVVEYGGGPPAVGDLLLGGTGPDGPWIARLPKSRRDDAPAECYELSGEGTNRGTWIETDAGFRLPKAQGFDPGPVRDVREGIRYEWQPATFCVNPEGQLTSFGYSPAGGAPG